MISQQFSLTLLGGALAILGAAVPQMFALYVQGKERKRLRAASSLDKLERIAALVQKTLEWFPKVLGNPKLTPPLEAYQLAMLCSLYFPKASPFASRYSDSLIRYHSFVIDCYRKGASVLANPEEDDRPRKIRLALDEALRHEAEKYHRFL